MNWVVNSSSVGAFNSATSSLNVQKIYLSKKRTPLNKAASTAHHRYRYLIKIQKSLKRFPRLSRDTLAGGTS